MNGDRIEYELGQISARLDIMSERMGSMEDKVESLIVTRAWARGLMWAAGSVAAVVSTAVSIFIAWIKATK